MTDPTQVNHDKLATRLPAMKARCDAATKDWIYDERSGCVAVYVGPQKNCLDLPNRAFIYYQHGTHEKDEGWEVDEQDCHDGKFIANACTDLPDVIAHYEDLYEKVTALRDEMVSTGIRDDNCQPVLDDIYSYLTEILGDGKEAKEKYTANYSEY